MGASCNKMLGEFQACCIPKLSWMRPQAPHPSFGAGTLLRKGLDRSADCLRPLVLSAWHCTPLDPATGLVAQAQPLSGSSNGAPAMSALCSRIFRVISAGTDIVYQLDNQ